MAESLFGKSVGIILMFVGVMISLSVVGIPVGVVLIIIGWLTYQGSK